jgi:hypothetical protein
MTAAFNFARPDASVPDLPKPSATDPRILASNCTTEPATLIPGFGAQLPGYPVPPNSMPKQEAGRAKRPSGPCAERPTKPRIAIHGLPREHCGEHGLRVKVHVHAEAKLRSVRVQVNGRTVRNATKAAFVVRVPGARLKKGVNRIVVSARDAGGGATVKSARFKLC